MSSTFKTSRYPELVVKFSTGRVKFTNGTAEVDDRELAAKLAAFAETHPDHAIEVIERERELTPKEKLKAKARELGLDDSGKAAEIEARIAAHEAAQDDADADDADDEDADDDEDQPEDEDA